jgi:superfamily II RNA helicase
VPLLKARVARELSDNEIYLCEVLMDNVLDNLEPNEIAAVLSVCYLLKYIFINIFFILGVYLLMENKK